MMIQCCVCGKIKDGGRWTMPDAFGADKATISHGYCPLCFNNALNEIHAQTSVQSNEREASLPIAANQ